MKLAIKKTTFVVVILMVSALLVLTYYRNLAIEELTPWCVPYCPPEQTQIIDNSYGFHEGLPALTKQLGPHEYTMWLNAKAQADEYISYSWYAGYFALFMWLLTYITEGPGKIKAFIYTQLKNIGKTTNDNERSRDD